MQQSVQAKTRLKTSDVLKINLGDKYKLLTWKKGSCQTAGSLIYEVQNFLLGFGLTSTSVY